jgi:transcriptional regulator with XRE-family HTH domain
MTDMPSGKEPEPGPFARAVSDEISVAMARRRVSGTQLANKIGRSQSYVSKRLNYGAAFTAHGLELISEVLGEDLLVLLRSAVLATRQAKGVPRSI